MLEPPLLLFLDDLGAPVQDHIRHHVPDPIIFSSMLLASDQTVVSTFLLNARDKMMLVCFCVLDLVEWLVQFAKLEGVAISRTVHSKQCRFAF